MAKAVEEAANPEAPADKPTEEKPKAAAPKSGRKRLGFARAPSVFHSAVYGMVAGFVFYGGYFAWRAYKLEYCNTEYYARQSRWRHFEKQQLYQRELGQKMSSHFVANLAQEYDPVALRKPDAPL
ncbi:hypothetical protein BgAZ_101710 [Babesia gibsoni]|uniref:Uncharacterized protein n=1 Tax=Babesia gibsoni TaxID=33632 RepID=A0AAD8URB7_BABGI|nr:hypothetical protein BgAZ_101710 [Babesia gibsoni]